MNILFMDDDIKRQQAFERNNPGHNITSVGSAFEAICLMRKSVYEVVFLDHDLDDSNTSTQSSNGTGLHVVSWLANCAPEYKPLLVVVHSINAIQAGEMMRHLTEDGYACLYLPYSWERKGLADRLQTLLRADTTR